MQTKDIPALIMLIGGAVFCTISFIRGESLHRMLIILLISLIVFFFIGCLFRYLIEKHLDNVLNPEEEEPQDEIDDEGLDAEVDGMIQGQQEGLLDDDVLMPAPDDDNYDEGE